MRRWLAVLIRKPKMATTSPRTALAAVLAELPGRWVAVDRITNQPMAAADSPDKLAVEIRERKLRNVTVVRAPDPSEPELVGLG